MSKYPCDEVGCVCPFNAQYNSDCVYQCGLGVDEDSCEDFEEEGFDCDSADLEVGFDPYLGCYTDDC